MIHYVTLGTNDLERAARFYDALLGELGAQRDPDGNQLNFFCIERDEPHRRRGAQRATASGALGKPHRRRGAQRATASGALG